MLKFHGTRILLHIIHWMERMGSNLEYWSCCFIFTCSDSSPLKNPAIIGVKMFVYVFANCQNLVIFTLGSLCSTLRAKIIMWYPLWIVVQALYFEGKNFKIPDFESANIRAFTLPQLDFSNPQTLKMERSSYSCYILKFVSIHTEYWNIGNLNSMIIYLFIYYPTETLTLIDLISSNIQQ